MAREQKRSKDTLKANLLPHDPLRIPPQNIDAERALLGSVLLNANAMFEIADAVRVDAFYSGNHRVVFDAMLSLHSRGESIDIVTVSNRLSETRQLDDIGGRSFLSDLTTASVSPGSAKHYADIVQSKFILRSLITAGHQITNLGYDEEREIAQVLEESEQAIFQVASAPSLKKFSAIKDELTEAWERLERLQKNDKALRGVPTGFVALDNLLSGLQESDLIILAARPSMGKTALARGGGGCRLMATTHWQDP